MKTASIARILHDARCQSLSWRPECTREHINTWSDHARAVQSADDPAAAAHDALCDAVYIPGGCPDEGRHVEQCRTWLHQRGITA